MDRLQAFALWAYGAGRAHPPHPVEETGMDRLQAFALWAYGAGRARPPHPVEETGMDRLQALSGLGHSCRMSGAAGRCVLVGFAASLSSELVSHLTAWPEGMVTHQPISASFIVPGKPLHQLC